MTIVLLGNYPPDKQESMLRFADMLQGVFQQKGIKTAIWQPKPILRAFFSHQTTGLGKWAG